MQNNSTTADKRIVAELNYGSKTAKRVGWEAWGFTVIAPGRIEVANASYGYLKGDHTYTVTIENVDGAALPTECECPADQHHDPDCKHKVALASIGGPTVLNAALDADGRALSRTNAESPLAQFVTDGGVQADAPPAETDGCPHDRAGCDGPQSDTVGCFECYRPNSGAP